jgi:ankyrin repeat protein
MLCPKTEQQKLLLQLTLQASFIVSNVWNIPKLNLLLQVCEHFHPIDVNSKDLELMQLLLQAGMNPNVFNAEGSSPLHFLSKKESKNQKFHHVALLDFGKLSKEV